MKRYLLYVISVTLAMTSFANKSSKTLNEEQIFYTHFADMLQTGDELNDGIEKAYYYAISDLDNDGVKEFVLADVNKLKLVFKIVDGDLHLISPDYQIHNDSLNWNLVSEFYTVIDADRSNDITMRHHPIFAYDIDIARNRFTVPGDVTWDEDIMRNTGYNRMIHKPHVGNVRLIKVAPGSYDIEGQPFDLGNCYTFALDDAAVTKKMFRGYKNEQATPIIVPAAWLNDHTPLQYSRWLSGEPEARVANDTKRLIERYFGDQLKIRKVRWLATCQINERSFYEVVFQPHDGKVLLAFVCLAEGEVVATRNMWYDQDKNYPNSIDVGPDIDDLLYFAPEIMAMVATPEGLELYVRWHSLEGVHYDIWREVVDQFVTIVGNYHYIMAY